MAQSTPYAVAWRLQSAGVRVEDIATSLGVNRATVFRWLHGIRLRGLRAYERWRRECMQRRRAPKIDPRTKALLVTKRRTEAWCGQKLQWWLCVEHGIRVSVATIYRLLKTVFTLHWSGKRNQVRGPVPRATRPREVVQMDTVNLGNLYVLSVVDTYTREALVLPLRDLSSKAVAAWLPRLKGRFGPVAVLQTDNGSEFKSTFQAKVRTWAQTHRRIHPGVKEENGFVESFHRNLRQYGVGYHTWRPRQFQELVQTLQVFTEYYNTK